MTEALIVPKKFNTYADTFLLLGLAQIVDDALHRTQQNREMQLIDAGTNYRIQFAKAIDIAAFAQLNYTNPFPPVKGQKTDESQIPSETSFFDVVKEGEKRKLYQQYRYQTGGKGEWSEEVPKPSDPRTQNGAILVSMRHDRNHNSLWLESWKLKDHYGSLVTALCQSFAQNNHTQSTSEIVAELFFQQTGVKLPETAAAVKMFAEGETDLSAKTAKVIQLCTISDLEGFMVTEKKGQTLKRESVIEFGAVVSLPDFVKTQSYFHAKYGIDNPTPYNVQISSGLYATVLNIEAFRIGYNPHDFKYAIALDERKKRLDALLKSVMYTYLQPNGAKRNTNLPHPDDFEGVITVTTRRCPAPMISALESSYRDQIQSIADTLNRLNGAGTVHLFPFNNMAEFAEQIAQLITVAQPWESNHAEAIE